MVVGIRSEAGLEADSIAVEVNRAAGGKVGKAKPALVRAVSQTAQQPDAPIEFFFASDATAIIGLDH